MKLLKGSLVLASLLVCCYGKLSKKPEITSLHIKSDVKFRFATTTVVSKMKNPDVHPREAVFDVTLPDEAFVTGLKLLVDDVHYTGEVWDKDLAKKVYEKARYSGDSASYIGTRSRDVNRFLLNVTVAAGQKAEITLTYQELLKRKYGHYEQVIYIDAGQPVDDMTIRVDIYEQRPIVKVKVDRLRNDIDTTNGLDISGQYNLTNISKNKASVLFRPSLEFQQKQSERGMSGQFVVQYDIERQKDAGEMLLVNGYFVHFFTPMETQRLSTDVLFILDVSGSMAEGKMAQLKEAMIAILDQLTSGDRFNIMVFSTENSFWKNELVDIADEDVKHDALQYIKSLKAEGWTNIDASLSDGLQFMSESILNASTHDKVRAPVMVFLTDGEATAGELENDKILNNVQTNNTAGIPIFSLAFGGYADYELVKKLAIQNNGFGRKIYEEADAAKQIAGFYNEIASTLMSNVTFRYLDAPVTNVTRSVFINIFRGSEVVISGRIGGSPSESLVELLRGVFRMEITGNSADGPKTINVNSVEDLDEVTPMVNEGAFENIIKKMWAYLTIKDKLKSLAGSINRKEMKQIKKEVLDMALRHSFVTPLTAMVVASHEYFDHYDDNLETEFQLMKTKSADDPLYHVPVDNNQVGRSGIGNSGTSEPPSTTTTTTTSTPATTTTTTKRPLPKYGFPLIFSHPDLKMSLCFPVASTAASGMYTAYNDGRGLTITIGIYDLAVREIRLVYRHENEESITSVDRYTLEIPFLRVHKDGPWKFTYLEGRPIVVINTTDVILRVTQRRHHGLIVSVFPQRTQQIKSTGIFGQLFNTDVGVQGTGNRSLKYGNKEVKARLRKNRSDRRHRCLAPKNASTDLLSLAEHFIALCTL